MEETSNKQTDFGTSISENKKTGAPPIIKTTKGDVEPRVVTEEKTIKTDTGFVATEKEIKPKVAKKKPIKRINTKVLQVAIESIIIIVSFLVGLAMAIVYGVMFDVEVPWVWSLVIAGVIEVACVCFVVYAIIKYKCRFGSATKWLITAGTALPMLLLFRCAWAWLIPICVFVIFLIKDYGDFEARQVVSLIATICGLSMCSLALCNPNEALTEYILFPLEYFWEDIPQWFLYVSPIVGGISILVIFILINVSCYEDSLWKDDEYEKEIIICACGVLSFVSPIVFGVAAFVMALCVVIFHFADPCWCSKEFLIPAIHTTCSGIGIFVGLIFVGQLNPLDIEIWILVATMVLAVCMSFVIVGLQNNDSGAAWAISIISGVLMLSSTIYYCVVVFCLLVIGLVFAGIGGAFG